VIHVRALAAEQVGASGVSYSFTGQGLGAGGVRENEIAQLELPPVLVIQQVGIGRQSNDGNGSRPETFRNGHVRKVKDKEIRPPTRRQPATDSLPGIRRTNRSEERRVGKECRAR